MDEKIDYIWTDYCKHCKGRKQPFYDKKIKAIVECDKFEKPRASTECVNYEPADR